MRYIGYIRQSRTRDGSESKSIQREAIIETADRFGVELAGIIEEPDSTSGYANRGRSRPEFPRLLEALSSGEVDGVIVYKTDRLSRGGGPGWAPLFDAAEGGHLNTDKFVLTPSGFVAEFEIGIRATMDREESKKMSDRLTDVARNAAAKGDAHGGGHRPFGYCADKVTLNEDEAAAIRRGVSHVLSGRSVHSLAQQWESEGISTPSGRAWKPSRLARMLTSPRVAGLREHKGCVVGSGTWPAIVSTEEHEMLKRVLAVKQTSADKGYRRSYLLTGFMFCSLCGASMIGRPRSSDGVPTYMCVKAPGRPGCGKMRIVGPSSDRCVMLAVIDRLNDSEAVAQAMGAEEADQLSVLVSDVERWTNKLQAIAVMFANDEITDVELRAARATAADGLASAQKALDAHATKVGAPEIPTDLDEEGWRALGLERQRALLHTLGLRVEVLTATTNRFDPFRLRISWVLD